MTRTVLLALLLMTLVAPVLAGAPAVRKVRSPQPSWFVAWEAVPLRAGDRERLRCLMRLTGLEFIAVPTWTPKDWGPMVLEAYNSDSASYDLTVRQGGRSLTLDGTTGGLGGAGLQKPFRVETAVLGTVRVARDSRNPEAVASEEYALFAPAGQGPGWFGDLPRKLTLAVGFEGTRISPDTARRFLQSVRLVRL